MTELETAITKLTAAQDAFVVIADEYRFAYNALKRSKSKLNKARFAAASNAYDVAHDEIQKLHDDVALAEINEVDQRRKAERELEESKQFKLF